MNIVGLDLSLTATGVAKNGGCQTIRFKIVKNASELDKVARLRDLGRLVDRECKGADLVVIEGHSFNSQFSHAHSLGELHGVVKVCLFQRDIPFVLVPPASLKKFATGRGNAGKDEVLSAAIRDGSPASENNAADAWWLHSMAYFRYRPDLIRAIPQYRQQVLSSISWPVIKEKEEAVG